MKALSILFILFYSTISFADCGFDFGETVEDELLCDSINLNRVQDFFRVLETPYTNPSEAEDFEVTRLMDRTDTDVHIQMKVLFSTVYIDTWELGQEPELTLDTCNVYLTDTYEDEGWVFDYAECESMGEFTYDY